MRYQIFLSSAFGLVLSASFGLDGDVQLDLLLHLFGLLLVPIVGVRDTVLLLVSGHREIVVRLFAIY